MENLKLLLILCKLGAILAVTPMGGLPAYNNDYGEMEDMELRVAVEPGKVECFYQDAKANHNLEVSYQVVEISSRFEFLYAPSGIKDLTIDFQLRDPKGNLCCHFFE